jgi:DNA-binding NarL/FixJ family response regulator
MKKPYRIFIADDNRLFREGLASMLEEIDDITVVGPASSGNQALAKIKKLQPQVALVDIGMPDLTDEIMGCIEAVQSGISKIQIDDLSPDTIVSIIRKSIT